MNKKVKAAVAGLALMMSVSAVPMSASAISIDAQDQMVQSTLDSFAPKNIRSCRVSVDSIVMWDEAVPNATQGYEVQIVNSGKIIGVDPGYNLLMILHDDAPVDQDTAIKIRANLGEGSYTSWVDYTIPAMCRPVTTTSTTTSTTTTKPTTTTTTSTTTTTTTTATTTSKPETSSSVVLSNVKFDKAVDLSKYSGIKEVKIELTNSINGCVEFDNWSVQQNISDKNTTVKLNQKVKSMTIHNWYGNAKIKSVTLVF